MKFFAAIKSFDPRRIYEDKKIFCMFYFYAVYKRARPEAAVADIF